MCSLKVETEVMPTDLICRYCGKNKISLMEVGHNQQGLFLNACCEKVNCKKKMISDRHQWEIGTIRPIDYRNLHASGITESDRREIRRLFPSLKSVLSKERSPKPKIKKLGQQPILHGGATSAFYSQTD